MNKIAHLGIPGSFSFIAAKKYFGERVLMKSCKTIKSVFANLITQDVDFGIVPAENSTTGSIVETYDQLIENKMYICGEISLKIHHHLLVTKDKIDLKSITVCYSHPQAVLQCESFFHDNSWIKSEFCDDTGSAAQLVSKNKKLGESAIAGRDTADIYGLKILRENIEDNKNNFTRFTVIGRKPNQRGNKASVVFSVKHIPGSLFNALRPYAGLGLNLTKIESRPLFGKTWEYIFFADFEIDNHLDKVNQMIKEMKETTEFITVLGIFNKGETYAT